MEISSITLKRSALILGIAALAVFVLSMLVAAFSYCSGPSVQSGTGGNGECYTPIPLPTWVALFSIPLAFAAMICWVAMDVVPPEH